MQSKVKGYFINPEDRIARPEEVVDELESYYEMLNCDFVERQTMLIDGKKFTFMCDEEHLLNPNPYISVLSPVGKPLLCGPIFICGCDDEGNVKSLSDEDISFIASHIATLSSNVHPIPYPMITTVDYE